GISDFITTSEILVFVIDFYSADVLLLSSVGNFQQPVSFLLGGWLVVWIMVIDATFIIECLRWVTILLTVAEESRPAVVRRTHNVSFGAGTCSRGPACDGSSAGAAGVR